MRRPHVYERSAPRTARGAYQQPAGDAGGAGREIAATLASLIAKAEGAGLSGLADLLDRALAEAERAAGTPP